MPHSRFSSEEIVRRGEDLYEQSIRTGAPGVRGSAQREAL